MDKDYNLSEIMTRKKAESESSKLEPNTQIRMPLDSQADSVLRDYQSAKISDRKDIMDKIIGGLEEGVIKIKDSIYHNEANANYILQYIIESKSVNVPLDKDRAYLPEDMEAFKIEVMEQIRVYADDSLYDSCVMWCEALEWDRKMLQPIIRGSGGFFRGMEELGYPHLCLLIKAAK